MVKIAKKKEALYDLAKHGVTQSLLSMWLACREKARLYLEGWNSKYHSAALMFGSLGHGMLELAYKDISNKTLRGIPSAAQCGKYSRAVEKMWLEENPKPSTEALEDLELFMALLEMMLPKYFDFWNKDFSKVKWVALEEQFAVPMRVSGQGYSGEITARGKRDGRFNVRSELWLFETKTKSMINEGDLMDSLTLDFQVNLYLWAMLQEFGKVPEGALYNVIRKTALKMHKDEPIAKFVRRVAEDIDDRPEFYFVRMEIPIPKADIEKFGKELAGMASDFAGWKVGQVPHYKNPNSCVSKYGKCEYLGICAKGDFSSCVRRKKVFKELDDF